MHTHTFQHCVQRCCKQCLNSSIQPTNKGCILKSLVLFPSHINHRAKFMLQKSSMHVCRILVKWFQLTVFFSTITADLSVLKIMNQENKILKYACNIQSCIILYMLKNGFTHLVLLSMNLHSSLEQKHSQ